MNSSTNRRNVSSNPKDWSLAGFPVVAEFELRALWSTKSVLIGSLIFEPVLYLALLVAGLQGVIRGEFAGGYLTFVFPGLLALQTIQGFTRAMYRSTAERRWGMLALKRMAGVGAFGYVLAMAVPLLVSFIVQTVVSTPVGVLLGLRGTLTGWRLAVVLGCVLSVFWCAVALVLTAAVRNYQQRDTIIGLLMLPLTFSAPVFYSLTDAPRFVQIVALFNPLTYQVNAMRQAFSGEIDPITLAIVLASTVVALLVAATSVLRSDLLGAQR